MRAAGAALLAALLAQTALAGGIPSPDEVRARFRRSDAVLLDRRGEVVQSLRLDRGGRRLEWTALKDVSPALVSAVLAAEDRRFYAHGGVDWTALAAAAARAALGGRARGASTITMQLASALDAGLKPRGERHSPGQKLGQIRAALALERGWTKDEILEAYLNLAVTRGELSGVAAVSRGLFGKAPSGLEDPEALVLAALLRAPEAAAVPAARRARALAASLGLKVDEEELSAAAAAALRGPHRLKPSADLAPEAARRLLKPGDAARRSTLDGALQAFAAEALRARLSALGAQNVKDAALLVVDNASGDVLAYVGNLGERSSARYVDGVTARRQAGSSLKPFLYALAFERKLLTPASLLDDSPLDLPVGGGLYNPDNYDHLYRGPVSAREALASSINVPAVRTLGLVGGEAFRDRLEALGFSGLRPADFYGPSLALGTADVSLWDLVGAYRTLAEGGRGGGLRLDMGEPPAPPRRVVSEQAAFLVSDILSDRESRASTFGLESALATPFWTAVKTGTSKDMRDNWCVGYSARYTVGVWVGNFSGSPMWNVSGMSGAAPAWLDVMSYLHRGLPSASPKPPAGLVARGKDWFLAGTEPDGPRPKLAAGRPRIAYPSPGMVVALDPDIPAGRQVLSFEAQGPAAGLSWRLNGKALGAADATSDWSPLPGEYTLALVDRGGRALDQVGFQVRGARTDSADEAGAWDDELPEPAGQ